MAALLLAATACGGDDDTPAAEPAVPSSDEVTRLLGPENPASGEPVRIGLVSDGRSPAFDARLEIRAAQATADYWNDRMGGIGGRPIEMVTCETGADPAKGTDCANQMVEEGVAAVAIGQSSVPDAIWGALHDAGIPTMFFQTNGEQINEDATTSFVLANPVAVAFGLPVSVAEDTGGAKVGFVVLDVPVATSLFESTAPPVMENAGLDWELVRVPPGTADMTAQMQELVANGVDVVEVVGYDAFCIAAFQGLAAVGYTGEITAVSQCITDATREAIPSDQLEGIYITSAVALGATDDPTFQRYEAVMTAYGEDIDVDDNLAMVGYSVMASLATPLAGITGDVTPAAVTQAIKAMPAQPIPGGGGVEFRCGGSAMISSPAVCSNGWLRAALDGDGRPSGYEAVDSTDILAGL
ncbi:MAG TPA: ABC transporter substrate-binding protein [Acidimicrobiales bacterium]|nr:ABC transporter substrate-binding protein [Acidimicrobiales bacterium]